MNTFLYYTQDFNVGISSTMNSPFVQGGYTHVATPLINLFANPSAMAPPYILGGYTCLLMRVDQAVTVQDVVGKLHFDEST
jgi:hypothetical protein